MKKLNSGVGFGILAVAIVALLFGGFAKATAAVPKDAEQIKLVYVSENPRGHEYGSKVYEAYIDRVNKMGEGKLVIEYQDSGRLVKFKDMLPACKKGIADIFSFISSYCSGDIPIFNAFLTPFLFQDIAENTSLCWGLANEQQDFVAAMANWKAKPLYLGSVDPSCLHTTTKAIKRLEDLKGLRIRTSGGSIDQWLIAAGAIPVPVASAETYIALQRGVVDGVVMHSSSMWGWKWYEQLKHHYTMTPGLNFMPTLVGINTDTWAKLPKWAQDILLKAGQEHQQWLIEALNKLYLDVQKRCSDRGNTVAEIDPKEVQRFKALAPPVAAKFIADNGAAGQRTWDYIKQHVKNPWPKP